jgi:hypothetical protein
MIKAEKGKIQLWGDKAELATDFVMIVKCLIEEDKETFNYTKDEIDMLVKMAYDSEHVTDRISKILTERLMELLEGFKGED